MNFFISLCSQQKKDSKDSPGPLSEQSPRLQEVVGILEPIPRLLSTPGSSALQKVYDVKFEVPLASEDAGAWVFNAENNSLLGHIAGSEPENEMAWIVPAYQVSADLRAR